MPAPKDKPVPKKDEEPKPQTTSEAEPDQDTPPPQPDKPEALPDEGTKSDRIARLEAYVTSQGINLAEFDSDEVKLAHAEAAAEAEKKARALAEKVIREAVKPLTQEERLARLEAAFASNVGASGG